MESVNENFAGMNIEELELQITTCSLILSLSPLNHIATPNVKPINDLLNGAKAVGVGNKYSFSRECGSPLVVFVELVVGTKNAFAHAKLFVVRL